MHYMGNLSFLINVRAININRFLGQFAIDYFVLVYKTGYLIGAIVIACVAVTIALYIFFKLREKWMNLWYKRLGCACLMALAVCGKFSNLRLNWNILVSND